MNILLFLAIMAIVAALIGMMRKKITMGSSCCGEHERPTNHIRARDINLQHYAYRYHLKVDGMVCSNCAKRLENAFNKTGEMLATVDFEKKEVSVYSVYALERRTMARIVDSAGYTLMDFEELNG